MRITTSFRCVKHGQGKYKNMVYCACFLFYNAALFTLHQYTTFSGYLVDFLTKSLRFLKVYILFINAWKDYAAIRGIRVSA